jgi:hypothetical protein
VAAVPHTRVVLLFWLIGGAPVLLYLTLALAIYLTVVELREFKPEWRWWVWWISLVVLTHFIGYLILRGYRAYTRARRPSAP